MEVAFLHPIQKGGSEQITGHFVTVFPELQYRMKDCRELCKSKVMGAIAYFSCENSLIAIGRASYKFSKSAMGKAI